MMFMTQQVLTTLGWVVLALAISPMLWLLFQPYFKGLSPAERRATSLLRDMLTAEQCRQLIWRGYLEIPSPSTSQRVYRVPRARGYVQVIEHGRAGLRRCILPVACFPPPPV